jgi:hypothetical protein
MMDECYAMAPLEEVVYGAYCDDEMDGEGVWLAQQELKRRGFISQHELYHFCTWGN